MIQLVTIILGLVLVASTIAYLDAFNKFHGIVNSERPDWIQSKGKLSFFYDGMPKLADPKVSMGVIRTAFSSRACELSSPDALFFANRIRLLLPLQLLTFVTILVLGILQKMMPP